MKNNLSSRATALIASIQLLFLIQAAIGQTKSGDLILKVDQVSAGPFGGQKGALCLHVYADGRIVESEWSRSGIVTKDKDGKDSRSERTEIFEYQVPERDLFTIEELSEFLQSRAVAHLEPKFGPPHRPIDFFENSTIQITLPKGKSKTISVREYYAASLVERAKYPSALVILMEKLARLEDDATRKGKPSERPQDCPLQHE